VCRAELNAEFQRQRRRGNNIETTTSDRCTEFSDVVSNQQFVRANSICKVTANSRRYKKLLVRFGVERNERRGRPEAGNLRVVSIGEIAVGKIRTRDLSVAIARSTTAVDR